MNLIVLGAPGSGKGTQSAALSKRYRLKHVSSGDLLRAAVEKGDKEIEAIIASGQLVPDQVVLRLVRDAILENEGGEWEGWVLDGYPRTASQAEALEDVLSAAREVVDAVVFLEVEEAEVIKRLSGRGRSDDDPETVRERLSVFNEMTLPVLDFYELRYDVHRVNGFGKIEEITDEIARLVIP
jgi:adenylate kinase